MWSLCVLELICFGYQEYQHVDMAEERPKRQRKVRSCTEFFGASLLHKEEVELRRALNASLKEARNVQQKKQEKPVEPVIETVETRSICTNTNARIKIKASAKITSDKTSHEEHSRKKKKRHAEKKHSELFRESSLELVKSQNKTDIKTTKSSKTENKGLFSKEVEKCLQRKELQSPMKTHKTTKPCKRKELKILLQGKTARKLLNSKKVKSDKKSRAVQSLSEKFCAAKKAERDVPTRCAKRKKESEGESVVENCSEPVNKKKTKLQKIDDAKAGQISCKSIEEAQSTSSNSNCEVGHVPDALQGTKLQRRKIKHKFKDRKLVSPLGEIYIPANIAKTEDFLTFLCLRGNSSLPRSFDVFNNPDPFITQPAHQFVEGAFLSPVLPIQSSVTYSPPSSNAPSESSAASPMSSTDGWMANDD